MAHVTLKRPADSRAATITVPGVSEAYVVRENGTVDVHEDHVHHLRAAGFKWPHEVEEDKIVLPAGEAAAEVAADGQEGAASQDGQGGEKEPSDEFSKLNLAQLGEWILANGGTAEQVAAIKSKKDGRSAARAILAAKAKGPLS